MTRSPDHLSGRLDRAWRLIESGQVAAEGIVAERVEAGVGIDLMVGVDLNDARHLLLPLGAEDEIRGVGAGKWITVTKRDLLVDGSTRSFADIACGRPDFFDKFALLAAQVVAAASASPANPVQALTAVLADWREFLRTLSDGLGRQTILGLFAELSLLERLVDLDPAKRVDSWTGPLGGRYDFQRGRIAVEAKASSARRGRPIVVHGLDQLEDPPDAELFLWWSRLEDTVERGDSLATLVDRLLSKVTDADAFRRLLAEVEYEIEGDFDYSEPMLTVVETRLYRVDGSFPRLTTASLVGGQLPNGVERVVYEADLGAEPPVPLDEEATGKVFESLAGTA